MTHRVVAVTERPSRLFLRARQLVIEREGLPPASVPIEDMALLIVDQPAVSYSHPLLVALAEGKVATLLCGADHLPAALILPLAGHGLLVERQRAQLAAPLPLQKRLWQRMVRAKLLQQAAVLRRATGGDQGLPALAARVRSGDPDNLEAQGAQRYWPALFGRDFRRDRAAEDQNLWLNYGYAVLRAAVARAVVAAGLLPSVGVFHHNRADAFALASDLMEPYRPLVDRAVWECRAAAVARGLDRAAKTRLLAVLNETVALDGQTLPVTLAIERSAASLARAFAERRPALLLLPGTAAGEEADAPPRPPAAA